ncbi:MAG: tetratricopeptide repeat protein [Candidatus Fermentibacteraceae bacterium]
MVKSMMAVALVASLIAVAGCSSPAITGIKVHIQNGDYERAITLADSVLQGPEAGNAEVWYWKARAHSFIHDWENSAEAFSEVYRLDPLRQADIADFWTVFYNTANNRFTAGDIPGAQEMLSTGAVIAPDRPEFPQMLGDILVNQGQVEEALDRFDEAFALGNAMAADLEAQKNIETDPARVEYLENEYYRVLSGAVLSSYNSARILENLYLRSEDELQKAAHASRAVTILDAGLLLDPTNPDLLETKAEILLIQGKYDQALSVYDNAEQSILLGESEGWITPEESATMRGALFLTRGFALLEMERSDEALAQLEASRSLIGDSYDVLATIAHANVVLERYEQSLVALNQALALPGLTPEEMGNLNYMVFVNNSRMERDQVSLDALLTAIQYDPQNAMYYDYLASTYSRLGRRQLAIQAMEKAEELRRQQQ